MSTWTPGRGVHFRPWADRDSHRKKEHLRIAGARVLPPSLEVYRRHLWKEEERKQRPIEHAPSSRNRPPSNGRIASKVCDGIRKAHKAGGKDIERRLRSAERDRLPKIHERETVDEDKYLRVPRARGEALLKHRPDRVRSETAQEVPPVTTKEDDYPY